MENKINEAIKCKLCYELLYNPKICSCRNIICLNCFNNINMKKNPLCPYCRKNINNYNDSMPPLLKEILDIYQKECLYCDKNIFEIEYNDHIEKCSNEDIKCDFFDYGCNKIIKRALYKEHLKDCILNNDICKKLIDENNDLKKQNEYLSYEIETYKEDILELKIKILKLKEKYKKSKKL